VVEIALDQLADDAAAQEIRPPKFAEIPFGLGVSSPSFERPRITAAGDRPF